MVRRFICVLGDWLWVRLAARLTGLAGGEAVGSNGWLVMRLFTLQAGL